MTNASGILFHFAAFFLGIFTVWKLFREKDFDEEKVLDLIFLGMLTAIVTGRAVFVALNWSTYAGNLLGILNFADGGFNLEASILFFLLLATCFLHLAKWPFFPSLDYLALGGVVGSLVLSTGEIVLITVSGFGQMRIYALLLLKFLVLGLAVLVFKKYYRHTAVLMFFLISTFKPILVLTGILVFGMVNGRNLWQEFTEGFRQGFQLSMNNNQNLLQQEEKRLQENLSELESQDPKNRPQRLMENAPEEQGDEAESGSRIFALKSIIGQKLAAVKQALRDLRRGNYGICDKCGQKIDPARLKAVPDAQFCLECEKELEEQTISS